MKRAAGGCWVRLAAVAVLLSLAACGGPSPRRDDAPGVTSSGARKPAVVQKRGGGYYKDDGPADDTPENLDAIPDAQPRWEPLNRFTNRPYDVLGTSYVPNTSITPFRQTGIASWYGKKFHGQKTSIGEPYDMFAMTAAHPTLALPSYVRVRNPENGRSVVVRVIDRGPFHADRVIDLSYAAAYRLDYINKGSTLVEVEAILPGDETGVTYAQVKPPVVPAASSIKVEKALPAAPVVTPENGDGEADIEQLMQQLATSEVGPAADTMVLAAPATTQTAATTNAPVDLPKGVYLQLGAFSNADNADNLRAHLARELDWLNEAIVIEANAAIYRVQLGPYASRVDAEKIADRIRLALGYKPTFVTR